MHGTRTLGMGMQWNIMANVVDRYTMNTCTSVNWVDSRRDRAGYKKPYNVRPNESEKGETETWNTSHNPFHFDRICGGSVSDAASAKYTTKSAYI